MGFSISVLAEEDRPREKVLSKGIRSLSNAELVAVLIGSGHKEKNAIDLSKEILIHYKNNVDELARLSVNDLTKFKGIGEAKAIAIITAMELGRRRGRSKKDVIKITSSEEAFKQLLPYLGDLNHEQFWMLALNKANHLIRAVCVSQGGKSGTVVDPKILFKKAIDLGASQIIVAHNHPSGNFNPSNADKKITNKIKEGGVIMDIPILDHLIVTDNGYFSFVDEGILTSN